MTQFPENAMVPVAPDFHAESAGDPPPTQTGVDDVAGDASGWTPGTPGIAGLPQGVAESRKRPSKSELWDAAYALVQQSLIVRRDRWPRYIDMIDKAHQLYVGDHWDHPASEDEPGVVINVVQNTVLFVAHLMTEAPLRPKPRAAGRKGKIRYVLSAQGMAKAQQIPNLPGADGSMVSESQFQSWLQAGLGSGDSFEVTTESARQNLEDCIVYKWEAAGADLSVNENVLSCAAYGFGASWFRRDPETWGFALEGINCKRVYPDPTVMLEKDFCHTVADLLLWEDKAVRLMPEHEAVLRANAFSGAAPFSALGVSAQDWGWTDSINYYQRNVALRVMLLKHQRYPMDAMEAVQTGKVVQTQDGYTLADSNAPTHEGAENWPVSWGGVREILCVGNECFSDKKSDYNDFNIIWNTCRPVMGQPWGLGYATLIADLNLALDMLVTVLKVYVELYPWPLEAMPVSMADMLKNNEDQRRAPGTRLRVPDAMYDKPGFKGGDIYINPPPMPEGVFKFVEWVDKAIDKIGGYTDVMQGQGTPDAKAGVAIQELQSAAKGIFAYLSENTEHAVERIGVLAMELFTTGWVPESEVARILGLEDEPNLVRANMQVWRETKWACDVESMAGSLQARRQKRNEAIAAYEQTRPLAPLESPPQASLSWVVPPLPVVGVAPVS